MSQDGGVAILMTGKCRSVSVRSSAEGHWGEVFLLGGTKSRGPLNMAADRASWKKDLFRTHCSKECWGPLSLFSSLRLPPPRALLWVTSTAPSTFTTYLQQIIYNFNFVFLASPGRYYLPLSLNKNKPFSPGLAAERHF